MRVVESAKELMHRIPRVLAPQPCSRLPPWLFYFNDNQ
jgi:hypothetical protein